MRERTPLVVTITLIAIGLFAMLHGMMSPDMYRLTDPKAPVNYVFVPDDDEFVRSPHHVEGVFWSTSGESLNVTMFYRAPGGDYVEDRFQRIAGSDKFSYPLPSLAKGGRFFYFLKVRDASGHEIDIKPKRNFMDSVFGRGHEKLFFVTYEGRPFRPLLVLHVGFIVGAMLLMIHGFYFSMDYVLSGRGLSPAYWTLFSAWLLFTISVLPIGIFVAKSAYGVGWSGFPIGTDITDNKSLVVVVYWFVLLSRGWRPLRAQYAARTGKISGTLFAGLSLLGIILSVIVYAVPHSIFVQQ